MILGGCRGWASWFFLLLALSFYPYFKMLQDMAVARSCLTLWVYRILVRLFCDPPIARLRHRFGEGRGVLQLGLVQVS